MILASTNAHKLAEVRAILDQPIELAPADLPEVVEDATSFTGNALIKARAACQATGEIALADDSGLCVDVLGGAPGIFSARWAGVHGDDDGNLQLLLSQLQDMLPENRGASFRCVAVACFPDGSEIVAEGRLPGTLTTEPRGEGGFGYDPIFVPAGSTLTIAEMSAEHKNEISHRGAAFRELAKRLRRRKQRL